MDLAVERLLARPSQRRAELNRRIAFSGNRISSVSEGRPGEGTGLLAMPALANAHDHARAVKPIALGALEMPLEIWLAAITGAPQLDPYILGAVAFGRSALGGVASVMCHLTRPQGGMTMVEEARRMARAAHDVGLRMAFTPSLRDRNYLAYGDDERTLALVDEKDRALVRQRLVPKPLPPKEQVALVEEIAAAVASPLVNVQYGPAAVHWCSNALLETVAERSAATGLRIHMHLLETRYQREWADRAYPQGMLRFLDSIGFLSPRLSVAHAVWARPDELELMAERGVTISVNNSSNLSLRSGIPPLPQMLRAKVPVAIGQDGTGIDDDDDALRELRLGWFLHGGVGLEGGPDAATLMHAVCDTGRRSVTGIDEPAAVEPGRLADILVLDHAALSRDVIAESLEDLPLVLSRATSRHIKAMYVSGHEVVSNGKVRGIDLPALEAEMFATLHKGMAGFNDWQRTVLRMRAGLTHFYATGMHCA